MSNFTSDETFQLTEIAAMPRGMTLAEAEHYLMTDELPLDDPFRDISHTLTPEERQAQEDEANAHEEFDEDGLSDAEAEAFLSGESSITAAVVAAGFHEDQHRDAQGRWAKGIPAGVEPRQLGIHFYSGAGFRQLNEALRKGSGVKHISRSIVPNFHKGDYKTTITLNGATAVRHLDAAIDDSPVDHDTTLYRGTTAFHTPSVGDVFTDKGYTSTSSDRNRAVNYYGGNGRLLWEITVPKGERALPIDEGPNTHEKEVLLPRGSSFKITDVLMDDRGQTVIKARVVHEDGQDIIAAGFHDDQPRDAEGQWTDTPGSVATKSKLSIKKLFDGVKDALDGKNGGDIDDETASMLHDTYVYRDDTTGLHTEITRITPGSTNAGYSHVVRVFGKIYDKDNKYVGAFQRNLVTWKNNDDGSYVEHDSLYLNDDVQGGGFAQRFNAHAENVYRDAGFNQIRLYADVSVGGYAWATQGYDFQNHAGLELALSRVRGAIALKPEWKSNDKLQAEFEALKARSTPEHFANGTSPKPVELAMLGHELAKVPRDEKHLMWPGKSGLMEAGWHGVKKL